MICSRACIPIGVRGKDHGRRCPVVGCVFVLGVRRKEDPALGNVSGLINIDVSGSFGNDFDITDLKVLAGREALGKSTLLSTTELTSRLGLTRERICTLVLTGLRAGGKSASRKGDRHNPEKHVKRHRLGLGTEI